MTREGIEPQRQEARPTSLSHRQSPANPQNGCLVLWDTSRLQEWGQPRQAWHGHDLLRLHRSRRGHWELVAMPTQDHEVATTMPSWWEWAASWEHAKCRTSAIGSISSLVRVAEKTHPPSTPEAPIVMDESVYTPKSHSKSIYIFFYLSLYVLVVAVALELM